MKAEIDENGCLTISAETGIEGYALKKWWEEYFKDEDCLAERGVTLGFDFMPPKEEQK